MSKLKYFPFGHAFDLRMGTSVFSERDSFVEADIPHYMHEVAAKRKLLNEDHNYYYRADEGIELAQWDVLERVLTNLSVFYPQHFSLTKKNDNWYWKNNLLDEELLFVFGNKKSLPLQPLWIGLADKCRKTLLF